MKLSITQMALGIIIILAAYYIVGWMIFEVQSRLTVTFPTESGVVKNLSVIPVHETLFSISRYASGVLPVMGIVILISGVFQKNAAGGKEAAVIQMIAGVLTAVVSVMIITWGYPTEFSIYDPEGNSIRHSYLYSGRTMVRAEVLSVINLIAGAAVLGAGIVQLVRAKKRQLQWEIER